MTQHPGHRGRAAGPARTYLAIDLKSFYASVECADRGLDPFTTDLVVADPTRSPNTICLAVTPALKEKGVRNRCRLREIPAGIPYLTAMPRMHRYLEVSTDVYAVYLAHVALSDIWPYSVDEAFLDVTGCLALRGCTARELAAAIIGQVREKTGIAATAGIGPNMFLAKVALDVMAKHAKGGIAELDERSFRRDLWFHRPLTDIWGIGPGIERRLALHGIHDLAGICAADPQVLEREFGVNAAWLVDHAWGLEPATIADCRGYEPKARSLSNGQVLMRDYSAAEARTVVREMAQGSCLDLHGKGLACRTVGLYVGYAGHGPAAGPARGHAPAPPAGHAGGQRDLGHVTARAAEIEDALLAIYDAGVDPAAKVRRVCLWLGGVTPARYEQPTLFDATDGGAAGTAREDALAETIARARRRFGPNALLSATSLRPEANARERNLQIGGHRA